MKSDYISDSYSQYLCFPVYFSTNNLVFNRNLHVWTETQQEIHDQIKCLHDGGLGINYYPEFIWITIMKNGGWGKNAWGIEGWGFEQRSECKLLGSKVVDGKWVDNEKTDCPGIRELSAIFPTFDCTKSYPFKCDLNVSETF